MKTLKSVSNRSRRGFSIVEAVIIIALAVLVVGAAITLVGRVSPRIRIIAAQHEMSAVFAHARSAAVNGKKEVNVTFYPVEDSYTIDGVQSRAHASFGVIFDEKQPEEIQNAFVFHFHPDGSATSGTLSLFIDDYQRNLHIDGKTGIATIVTQP